MFKLDDATLAEVGSILKTVTVLVVVIVIVVVVEFSSTPIIAFIGVNTIVTVEFCFVEFDGVFCRLASTVAAACTAEEVDVVFDELVEF